MAIAGWELIAVVAVIAIVLLWGPGKIPELAKSIGRARNEFENAQRDANSSRGPQPAVTPEAPEDALIVAARKLGISTEGKTRDAISREIVVRATSNKTT